MKRGEVVQVEWPYRDLSGSKGHCAPTGKSWTDELVEWLSEEYDYHAFSGRRLVLPTPEFFPDPYAGFKPAVRTLLHLVCEYMDVVPDLVAMKLVPDSTKIWLVD